MLFRSGQIALSLQNPSQHILRSRKLRVQTHALFHAGLSATQILQFIARDSSMKIDLGIRMLGICLDQSVSGLARAVPILGLDAEARESYIRAQELGVGSDAVLVSRVRFGRFV